MTTDTNEMETVAGYAQAAAKPHLLEAGCIYSIVTPGAGVEVVYTDEDHWRATPERIVGTVALHDTTSLLAYWDKHADSGSELYADRTTNTITAVIDAHDEDPRWCQHRAVLKLDHHEALTAWLARDGRLDGQDSFAEFLEEQYPFIADPTAADMLEIAQSFHATRNVVFRSGYKVVSGQRQFEYSEEVNATAGRSGALAIPTSMTLHLPVWRGDTESRVFTARLRYSLDGGKLRLGVKLDRPTEVIDAAFAAVIAQVADGAKTTVLRGTPVRGSA